MANILFVSSSLGYAGAAKMLTFVAESFLKRGHSVSIVNIKKTIGDLGYTRRVAEGISVVTLDNISTNKQILEIIKIAKKQSVDVIIGFTEIPNAMARIAGFSLGIPSIMSERGDPVRTGVGVGIKNSLVLKLINTSRGGVFQTDGARKFYGRGLQKCRSLR